MEYQDIISWLYKQFPFYQIEGKKAYKKDINNVLNFFNNNGQDYLLFDTIHIAGTNGKGSVSHMLSSILQESGLKVGLFTSPHLIEFRERIKINNKKISKSFIIQFIKQYKKQYKKNKMSFFEMNVIMAFKYFAIKKVDVAIVEVGLGGRLDATNVISPKLSIITNISLDHKNLLGETIEEIAMEKAGIIKQNTPVVLGENKNCTKLIEKRASVLNATVFYPREYYYQTDLLGYYQKNNINTSITSIHVLKKNGYQVLEHHIINGLKRVVTNTGLMGRWQILSKNPLVICDIAHNAAALNIVFEQLNKIHANNKNIIIGLSEDKDLNTIISSLPKLYNYYLCGSFNTRIANPTHLESIFRNHNLKFKIFDTSISAYEKIMDSIDKDDLIMITGSTFIISDILNYFYKI